MNNKKTRIIHEFAFLCITIAFLITCNAAFAQTETITKNDDAEAYTQKILTIQHIDPNTAAKVVNQIVKLKIFQLSKDTLVVPNHAEMQLTVRAENSGQMNLIENIIKNIDFQITNEGTIDRIHIPVTNLIFDEIQRITSPLLSQQGHLSYNITEHMLVVTEITENLNHIENLVTKLDSYDFDDPNSIPDTAVNNASKQTDANSVEVKAADSNDPMVSVQFSGFKIEQITERLKQWTGKEVVPSQEAMNLRITIFAPEKMKRSEAIKLLYSAMIQQGFTTEETNNTIYIKPTLSTGDHIDIVAAEDSLENIKNKDMMIRKIFQLKYSSPSIMGQLILPYLSSSGHFTAYDSTKTLMVGDTVKNLIQIKKMIEIFDSDPNTLPKGGVITPTIPDDPVIDVNLINAGINQIIDTLIRWTGKAVLPSNKALGLKITLSSPEKILQSEALNLLYKEIRKQGLIVENRNNILYITRAQSDPGQPIKSLGPDDSLDKIEDQDMIARIIFKLKYYNPKEMGEILLPLLSPLGNMTSDEITKTLMITDIVKKLKQYKEIIEQFDSESPIPSGSSELSTVKDPNEVIKIINQILKQQTDPNYIAPAGRTSRTKKQADSNSVPKDDVINPDDPNEKAQRQESEAVYVKYVDADIGAEKLQELLKEIEIDLTNRLIILPLATSKQILVFGNNEKDRELAESLIHNIDLQAAENSYDFEKISLKYIEPEIFSKLVTNVLEEYRNLKLNLYPVVASKQILVFGGKEYRNVVRRFAEKIDFQTSLLGTEDPNSPDRTKTPDIFLKVFEIHNWNSVELAEMLNAIIKNKINNDFTANLEADPITLIPWPEKHWLIVKASEESITFIAEWIKKLDSEYLPDTFKNPFLSKIEDPNQINQKIYNLKYSLPSQISQIITPLLSDKGSINAEDDTGTIIVRDKVIILIQLDKIINEFDKLSEPDNHLQIFEVYKQNPAEIVKLLNNFLTFKMDTGSPSRNLYESTPIAITPNTEKNWVITRAPDGVIKVIEYLLTKIDSESPSYPSFSDIVENTQIGIRSYFFFENNFPENIIQLIEPLLSDEGYLRTEEKEDNTGTLSIIDKPDVLEKTDNIINNYNVRVNKEQQVSPELLVAIQTSGLTINGIKEALTKWTGKKVIASEEAKNLSIIVYSAEKLTRSNAVKLLFAAIRYQGFFVEETEDSIYIKNRENLLNSRGNNWTDFDRIQIIFADMDELIENIRTILRGSDINFTQNVSFRPLIELKQILITGDKKYKDIIKKIIAAIDKPSVVDSQEYGFIPINEIDINELTDTLHSILKENDIDYKNKITIIPMSDLKQLFIYGDKETCKKIRELLQVLGIEPPPKISPYDTISIKYTDLDEVIEYLLTFMQGMEMDFPINVPLQALPSTKQILVFGKKDFRENIKKIVALIDTPDSQLQRKVFQLKYADSKDVKTKVDELFGGGVINKPENVSADMLITIANPSRNEFIVLTSKDKMKEIEKQVSEWNSPIEIDPLYPRLYTIHHVDKEEIINFLLSIFSSNESGDNKSNNTLIQSPVIEMYKNKISFLNLPDSNDILAESYIAEGYLLLDAIINEIDKKEFVPFDKNKAYNRIRENLKTIEESIK